MRKRLAVMLAGAVVKSKQTGFGVALPPKQVGALKVVSLFGDSETNEGAVCQLTSGTVDASALENLFVMEAKP